MKFADFLNEAPLPDNWDKPKFNNGTFKSMIEYATAMSEKVGSGSSRVAFKIPYKGRDTVLKVAKNKKGVAQNKEEMKYLYDGYIQEMGIVIPIIDHDEYNNDAKWIHTEMAEKIKPSYFKKETGVDLADLVDYCYNTVACHRILTPKQEEDIEEHIDHDSDLVMHLTDLFHQWPEIGHGDLKRIANWGLYKGKAVILDLGFNSVSAKLYGFRF